MRNLDNKIIAAKLSRLNRREALQLGSVVLMLGVQHIARGATIVAVRVWPSKDYTRLTIESDGEIKTRQFFVTEPPQSLRRVRCAAHPA